MFRDDARMLNATRQPRAPRRCGGRASKNWSLLAAQLSDENRLLACCHTLRRTRCHARLRLYSTVDPTHSLKTQKNDPASAHARLLPLLSERAAHLQR